MGTEALAQLYPSKTRIILTVLVLAALAVVCLFVAAGEGGQGAAARLMLAAVAVAAALGAAAVWRSGARGLALHPDRIAESGGDTVLWLADIARLERGAFAFKPANGVVVSLRRPGSLRWVPGLWWRTGARVGIGGMTPKAATKAFADLLERRLGELRENG